MAKRKNKKRHQPTIEMNGGAAAMTMEPEMMNNAETAVKPAPMNINERADTMANGMFSVTTATLPTGIEPALVDMQAEKFHGKSKLYYLASSVAALLSIVMLFAVRYADDLDIEDWAEDPMVSVLAYGGLVAAFFLWRQAEKSMDQMKTLVMMLRNYYAHREGQISRGELTEH
jgi:hypothetical protein